MVRCHNGRGGTANRRGDPERNTACRTGKNAARQGKRARWPARERTFQEKNRRKLLLGNTGKKKKKKKMGGGGQALQKREGVGREEGGNFEEEKETRRKEKESWMGWGYIGEEKKKEKWGEASRKTAGGVND